MTVFGPIKVSVVAELPTKFVTRMTEPAFVEIPVVRFTTTGVFRVE